MTKTVGKHSNVAKKSKEFTTNQQKFFQQKSGQKARNVDAIIKAIYQYSGGDVENFLKYFFYQSTFGKNYKKGLVEEHFTTILTRLGKLHKTCKIHEKRQWHSLVADLFTNKELREYGWEVTSKARQTALKHGGENGFGNKPVFETPKSKQKCSEEDIKEIIDFFTDEEISRVSSYNFKKVYDPITGKKKDVPKRYLEYSLSHCYMLFKNKRAGKKEISKSTFCKYKPKQVVFPKRFTDMCPICVGGKHAKDALVNNTNLSQEQKAKYQAAVKKMEDHIEHSKGRRLAYKEDKRNLSSDEVLFVMDFKQNVKLNKGHLEVSMDFFNAPSRSYLTLVTFYKEGAKTKKKYWDFMSQCLTHDAQFVGDCIDQVLSQADFLKEGNRKSLIFWSDNCAGQFKNAKLMAKYARLSENGYQVKANFFTQYHGKSVCDAHFALINRYYQHSTKDKGVFVDSTQSFIDTLMKAFADGQAHRQDKLTISQRKAKILEEKTGIKKEILEVQIEDISTSIQEYVRLTNNRPEKCLFSGIKQLFEIEIKDGTFFCKVRYSTLNE